MRITFREIFERFLLFLYLGAIFAAVIFGYVYLMTHYGTDSGCGYDIWGGYECDQP